MSFEPIPCPDCGALDSGESTKATDRYGNSVTVSYCGECGEVMATSR